MHRHLFRSRWVALAFVILMMTSAVTLVGTEDEGGFLDHATAKLHGQKRAFEQQVADLSTPSSNRIIIDADELGTEDGDDSLVDPGTGEDPTPQLDEPLDPTPDLDPAPAP